MNDIDFDELDRAVASALSTAPTATPAGDAQQKMPSERRATSAFDESVSHQPEAFSDSPRGDDHKSESTGLSSREANRSGVLVAREGTLSPLGRRTIMRRRDEAVVSPAQKVDEVATASVDSTENSSETPTAPPEASASSSVRENEQSPVVSPPRKRIIPHRSGRVMDVIASKPKSSHPISRVATTVSPMGSVANAPMTESEPPVIADVLPPSATKEPFDLEGENIFATINSVESQEEADFSLTENPEAGATPEETLGNLDPVPYETDLTTFDETMARQLAQPLAQEAAVSPFLSDAKVEKRPLGGSEPQVSMLVDVGTGNNEPTDVSDGVDTSLSQATYKDAATPAELDRDIVAVESQELDIPDPRNDQPSTTSVPQKKISAAQTPTGPTSITRQYKESPRVASEHDESGAIFDPQTYHVGVEPSKKRAFGWGWVIAIMSVILLAAVFAVLAWMEGILPVPL